jgi:hypothetical protein
MYECSCECVKYSVRHRRQDGFLKLGGFRTLISHCTNQGFERKFIQPAFSLHDITELQINCYYYYYYDYFIIFLEADPRDYAL